MLEITEFQDFYMLFHNKLTLALKKLHVNTSVTVVRYYIIREKTKGTGINEKTKTTTSE